MPAVDVRLVDVVKKFGDTIAVDHIDLEVQDGEFFSLLGPSGCGKTTTLRMIGGFEEPTSGLIELQGQDVTWLPPYKRHVNTVFQNYALFPHLTVEENVAFGLKYKDVSKQEMRERVANSLELVALTGFEKRRPSQLSGGQQQRVALARALILNPAVLLLDAPHKGANVLSQSVLQELSAHLDALEKRQDLAGLIIRSGKPGSFIAGADLREFAAAKDVTPEFTQQMCTRGRTLFQWGIADAADRVVGTTTLLHVSDKHARAEIGFALGREHWRKGYASDAVVTLIRFCFEELRLHRIEADADPRNDRSLRLLEKLGFRREGLLRQRYRINGEMQDAVFLALLESEWPGRR